MLLSQVTVQGTISHVGWISGDILLATGGLGQKFKISISSQTFVIQLKEVRSIHINSNISLPINQRGISKSSNISYHIKVSSSNMK